MVYNASKAKNFSNQFNDQIEYDAKLENFWNNQFSSIEKMDENNKFIYLFQNSHLQCLLDRLDLMSMSHSVEARVPL